MAANPQTVINLINQQITTNGTNAITANVLAPVLVAMVNQINNLVGAQVDFPESADTVAESLNNLEQKNPQGVTILAGTEDPNITPPPVFTIGDFFQLLDGPNTVAFYQYNGIGWARIVIQKETNQKPIREINASYVMTDEDFTVIYDGANPTHTLELPLAVNNSGRILKVSNLSIENINFTTNYIDNDGSTSTLIQSEKVIQLQSDGTNWFKTN